MEVKQSPPVALRGGWLPQLPPKIDSLEETWAYIQAIDFTTARRKLMKPRFGTPLPEEVVDHCVADYQRFLYLIRKYDAILSPTLDIDIVWHEHIMDTKPYFRDTAAIFGRYLHHEPNRSEGGRTPELQVTFNRTGDLWSEEFGEDLATYFGDEPGEDEEG